MNVFIHVASSRTRIRVGRTRAGGSSRRRYRPPGRVLRGAFAAAFLALAGLAPLTPRASAAPVIPGLRVVDGRVSGRVTSVPAAEVVAAIADLSDAKVIGTVRNDAPVRLDLVDEPIVDVLPRLLEHQGFHLVYRADGSVSRIAIHDSKAAEPARLDDTPDSFSLPPPSAKMLGYRVRVRDGALADLVGPGHVSVAELLRFALQHDDPAVRADAVRTGLRALPRIPGARAWLRETFTVVARHPISAFQAAMDPAAREGLRRVMTQGSDGRLRQQAADLLADDVDD
jgi:hypothetical protein